MEMSPEYLAETVQVLETAGFDVGRERDDYGDPDSPVPALRYLLQRGVHEHFVLEVVMPSDAPEAKQAAVRAMDAVQQYIDDRHDHRIDDFIVIGGSKRGWTTWTTAAVDNRVVAIMPIVIDLLNVEESFKHHYQVYGGYAAAVGDYEYMGIMKWMGSPEFAALMDIVEPYEYRDRLQLLTRLPTCLHLRHACTKFA